ncbi:MAG: cytochrome o ubiquinol oxidase subunit IV [Gammaproteobacteria bacterium RIFCSPHIGHO2_12_FULL_41_20]|nr:MAG: cytochrome o ubiquinol oxidase subunit IV [Gammaproteobacteria bacterium RIFCSPHIGHO2_12_FULL_41_20]
MGYHEASNIDYGTGQKKLSIYVVGVVGCVLLTLIAFWVVMSSQLTKGQILAVIYAAACLQFLVQLLCFLRLNTQTEQGRINVMALIFTGVILLCIIMGSLWIMWNLHYNMMH